MVACPRLSQGWQALQRQPPAERDGTCAARDADMSGATAYFEGLCVSEGLEASPTQLRVSGTMPGSDAGNLPAGAAAGAMGCNSVAYASRASAALHVLPEDGRDLRAAEASAAAVMSSAECAPPAGAEGASEPVEMTRGRAQSPAADPEGGPAWAAAEGSKARGVAQRREVQRRVLGQARAHARIEAAQRASRGSLKAAVKKDRRQAAGGVLF